MALTEAEKNKIIEEERIRADERAKYAQAQPQQVIVKEKRSSGAAVGCLALIIIGVVSALVLNSLGDAREKARKAQEQAATSALPPVTSPAFDVPSLVGKNLNQVQAVLGTPVSAPTPPAAYEGVDWDRAWEKDGQRLAVSYDLKTLRIIDFFIEADDPSGATKDTNRLLTIGNLKTDNPRYEVEFVPVLKSYNDPGSYTGVKITPK